MLYGHFLIVVYPFLQAGLGATVLCMNQSCDQILFYYYIASENDNLDSNGGIFNNSNNSNLKYAIIGVASLNALLVLIVFFSFTICLIVLCRTRKKQRVCINNEQEMARVNHRGYNILNRQVASVQAQNYEHAGSYESVEPAETGDGHPHNSGINGERGWRPAMPGAQGSLYEEISGYEQAAYDPSLEVRLAAELQRRGIRADPTHLVL